MVGRTSSWVGLAVLILSGWHGLIAQTGSSMQVVVRDALTGRAVPYAVVRIQGRMAVTDSSGRANVALDGSCQACPIDVRHSGYEHYVDTVRVSGGMPITVFLMRKITQLPRVDIVGRRGGSGLVHRSYSGEGLPGSLTEEVARVPAVQFSRVAGWDTRLSIEGIDSRRLFVSIEGAPMYSVCPMEMGGCLSGVSSALADDIVLTTDINYSGFSRLNVSGLRIPYGVEPGGSASVFTQVNSASMGYESGAKAVYWRRHWGIGGVFTYARHNDYYTARGRLDNTGYVQVNGLVKQVVRLKKWGVVEGGLLTLQIWDAGYPGLAAWLDHEGRTIGFARYTRIGRRLSLQSGLTYQGAVHMMRMRMQRDSMVMEMLSGANSQIANWQTEMHFKWRERVRVLATLYGEHWRMDAYVGRSESSGQRRPQIDQGLREEGRATAGARIMVVPNRLISELRIGYGVARWLASGHNGKRVGLPIASFVLYAYGWEGGWSFALTGGYNYRLPTLVELYREQVVVAGRYLLVGRGDQLNPERAFILRVSGEKSWLAGKLNVSLALFSRSIQDYIVLQVDTGVGVLVSGVAGIAYYVNVPGVWIAGVSATGRWHLARFTGSVSVDYTYGRMWNGAPAPYIAPLTIRVRAGYGFGKSWRFLGGVEHQFAQDRYNPAFGEVATWAWTAVNAGLEWEGDWGRFQVMGKNLLNQYYRYHLSPVTVYEPGRHVEARLQLNVDWLVGSWRRRSAVGHLVVRVPIRCERCRGTVLKALKGMRGVRSVRVDLDRREVHVEYIRGKVYPDQIIGVLSRYFEWVRVVGVE